MPSPYYPSAPHYGISTFKQRTAITAQAVPTGFSTVWQRKLTVLCHIYIFSITAERRLRQMLDSVQRSHLPGEALPTMPNNGLSNRIRCLFENATATEHGAHCPLLWRMYLNFMVCDGNAVESSTRPYRQCPG